MSLGGRFIAICNWPGLQRVVAPAVVGHDAEDELVEQGRLGAEGGRPPGVGRVLRQVELAAHGVAGKLEWTGADRVAAEPGRAVLLQRGRRRDAEVARRLLVQKARVGRGEADLDRVGVDDLGLFVWAEGAEAALGLGGRVDDVVVGGLDRRRVELRAVVEGDVLAQLEGVDRRVRRHRVALGEAGDELAAAVAGGQPPDERVEHGHAHQQGQGQPGSAGVERSGGEAMPMVRVPPDLADRSPRACRRCCRCRRPRGRGRQRPRRRCRIADVSKRYWRDWSVIGRLLHRPGAGCRAVTIIRFVCCIRSWAT